EGVEGQGEKGSAALLDTGQRGAEGGIHRGLVTDHVGWILQPPVSLQRRAEVQRTGLARSLVADGDDDIWRVVGEGVVALAAQTGDGNTGLLQCGEAARQYLPLGKAPGTHRSEACRRQMVEHGFGK